jgi:NTE family protein
MAPSSIALVLSGGGARAAYQAGALAAVAEIAPDIHISIITGVSAGAINAVSLAAHTGTFPESIVTLRRNWELLGPDDVFGVRPLSLIGAVGRMVLHALTGRRRGLPAFRGLLDPRPLRRFLERHAQLEGIGRNIAEGRLRAVALSATVYGTGATATFVQGAPDIPLWSRTRRYAVRTTLTFEHVLASGAIPIIFPAVRLEQGFFGDGSVRQTAPLAPAIHLGADHIIAVNVSVSADGTPEARPDEYPSSAELFGLLFDSVFLDALDADAERLERMNSILEQLTPGQRAASPLRQIGLLLLRPSRDLGAMSRGYRSRLPPLLAAVVRNMGGRRVRAADFVSYLLFDRRYTGDLMDLGYHDTVARRSEVEAFLESRVAE